MPCYTVQTMSVEFQAKNKELLISALNQLGWHFVCSNQTIAVRHLGRSFSIDLTNHRASIQSDQQQHLNELKRAYSTQAIKQVAAINKWQIANVKGNRGQFVRGIRR